MQKYMKNGKKNTVLKESLIRSIQSNERFQGKRGYWGRGFGKVYKGVLRSPDEQIAIKKVTHNLAQGMKQFVADIVSMGRLQHRSLVQLRGYCRQKGELLLVYDYMPNGSLDKILYGSMRPNLKLIGNGLTTVFKPSKSNIIALHQCLNRYNNNHQNRKTII